MRGRLPRFGTFTGTGAALTITLDFAPVAILVYNETDYDEVFLGISGQAAGKGVKIVGAAGPATMTAGFTFGTRGIKVGTDADLNEAAKVYRYVAF